jgi:hypothetical protein
MLKKHNKIDSKRCKYSFDVLPAGTIEGVMTKCGCSSEFIRDNNTTRSSDSAPAESGDDLDWCFDFGLNFRTRLVRRLLLGTLFVEIVFPGVQFRVK